MELETLKQANELKVKIEDRKEYGKKLKEQLEKQGNDSMNYLHVAVAYASGNYVELIDVDQRDIFETAIARNDREITKLQKQFDNL